MAGLQDIAKEAGLNPTRDKDGKRVDTTKVLERFWEVIIEHCRNGETVRIKDFGTFKARVYKGRTLKSPLLEDGEVTFDDQLVLRFHQSVVAKRKLNQDFGKKASAKKSSKKASAKKASAKKAGKKTSKSRKSRKAPAADEE